MSVREKLLTLLDRFDDDAFAALANRGLLRRAQKDLEKTLPVMAEETADTLVLTLGEHRIAFDARGPAQAKCSCPASGVCQHILGAAIGLRAMPRTAPSVAAHTVAEPLSPPEPPAQAVTASADLQESLVAIPQAALVKHAGKPGYRWACQFVADLDLETVEIQSGRNLVIGFRAPRVRYRYMGGGPDALIADTDLKSPEKYQVAAVLAARRAFGHPIEELAAPAPKAATAALDLGKDHALPETGDAAERSSRARLLASVRQLVAECIALGLSHLSPAIEERFATVATWAQGAECYRLALLLRRITDHIEQLQARAGGADEHRLLDEMTLAYALAEAIGRAAATGRAAPHLLGRARTSYEKAAAMDLLGLGAFPWRSGSGYCGLTLLFWCQATGEFHTCTDARPESTMGFDPVARYKSAGPWTGLGSPKLATGRLLHVSEPLLNAEGRLSANESITVALRDADVFATLKAIDDWDSLVSRQSDRRRSLLAAPQPLREWVVVAPARFGAATFDPQMQMLRWPLFDGHGTVLSAELAWSSLAGTAITRIERLSGVGLPDGTLVAGRARVGADGGLLLEPMSLIVPGRPQAVESLYFDEGPAVEAPSLFARLFKRGAAASPAGIEAAAEPLAPDRRPEALRQFRHWLHRQGERGLPPLSQEGVDGEFVEHLVRCGDAGLSSMPLVTKGSAPLAERLLRANYLSLQTEALMGIASTGGA